MSQDRTNLENLPTWEYIFRKGIAPNLSRSVLVALKSGLERNDPALIQGRTVVPDPYPQNMARSVEAGDSISYGLWKSGEAQTVEEAEERFAQVCADADLAIGYSPDDPVARYYLNWWDDTPRDEAVKKLLAVVASIVSQVSPVS